MIKKESEGNCERKKRAKGKRERPIAKNRARFDSIPNRAERAWQIRKHGSGGRKDGVYWGGGTKKAG